MRKLCCFLLVGSIGAALVGRAGADDKADARAIIDKAIAAMGGKDKLAKFKAQTWNEKGTYHGMGKAQPYTGKYALQFPNRFRMEIEGVFVMVVNGDQGWLKMGGETKEMPKEMIASEQENLHAGWVASLMPLDDKAYSFAPLGESKIEGKAVVGVKVSHKGHGDVQLYFDKTTGLLAKSAYTATDQEQKGKEVQQEVYFSDYKEVAGLKHPGKLLIKRDGKVFVEATNDDVKTADKLDDKLFAKP